MRENTDLWFNDNLAPAYYLQRLSSIFLIVSQKNIHRGGE